MAEQFAKERNPAAELLWVDAKGEFRKFEKVKVRKGALLGEDSDEDDSLGTKALDDKEAKPAAKPRVRRTLPATPKSKGAAASASEASSQGAAKLQDDDSLSRSG